MANDYCTAAEIRALMVTSGMTSADDTLLTALATRASRLLDQHFGREPGWFYVSADTTRYFKGSGCAELWISEVASITSVAVDELGNRATYTPWTSGTDFDPWPFNAAAEGQPIRRLDIDSQISGKMLWYSWPRAVRVIGKFGWATTVPADIKYAAIIQSVRILKRSQNAFNDLGAIMELGQVRYVNALDPEVAALLVTPGYMKVTI